MVCFDFLSGSNPVFPGFDLNLNLDLYLRC